MDSTFQSFLTLQLKGKGLGKCQLSPLLLNREHTNNCCRDSIEPDRNQYRQTVLLAEPSKFLPATPQLLQSL